MYCLCAGVRCRGPDILSLAEERDIVVMTCPKRMYEACGLLYSNGLRGNCDGDN